MVLESLGAPKAFLSVPGGGLEPPTEGVAVSGLYVSSAQDNLRYIA